MTQDDSRASVPERRAAGNRPELDGRIFTVRAGGEWFGLPVACVHTVFNIESLTSIPLAPRAIAGLVNLRGRILTAVSLRERLDMPPPDSRQMLAIGIEHRGEALALLVDEAGDVLTLSDSERIPPPPHMTPGRKSLTQSVFRLEHGLLCVLDTAAVFDIASAGPIAA